MSIYDDRVAAAYRKHVSSGIRKNFEEEFDFEGMSDEDVLARHQARFSETMTPEEYRAKLDEVYGKEYQKPSPTFGERAASVGEHAKELAVGALPYIAAETPTIAGAAAAAVPKMVPAAVGKAAAKIGTSIAFPGIAQTAFTTGHFLNAKVDEYFENQLRAVGSELPYPNIRKTVEEFYAKLQPGLAAKGYTDEQIREEAKSRALNVARGYIATTSSIEQDAAGMERARQVGEPSAAIADAAFYGIGAPIIEGIVQKSLAKVGLVAAAGAATKTGLLAKPASTALGGFVGSLVKHSAVGAGIGGIGMGAHGAAEHAIEARMEGKTPAEIGAALVQGGEEGFGEGVKAGAVIGATLSTLGAGVAAPFKVAGARAARKSALARANAAAEAAMRKMEADALAAEETALVRKGLPERDAEMLRTAQDFQVDPAALNPAELPAEVATTYIQMQFGDEAARSMAGMQAASQIAKKIQRYTDANAEIAAFGQRALAPAAEAPKPGLVEPVTPGMSVPTVERVATPGVRSFVPSEQGGRPTLPEEIRPLAVPAPQVNLRQTPEVPTGREPVTLQTDTQGRMVPLRQDVPSLPVPPSSERLAPKAEVPAPEAAVVRAQDTIRTALEGVKASGGTGYTFNPRTFETVAEEGKVVTLKGDQVKGMPTPEQIEQFRDKHSTEISQMEAQGQNPNIGVFAMEDKPGVWSIDLNTRVATDAEAQAIGKATGQESYADLGPGGEWRSNPRIKTAKNALGRVKLATEGVTEKEGGVHIEGLKHPTGKFGDTVDEIVRAADEHEVPTTVRLTRIPGPRGGMIPIEKQLKMWEQRGFKLVESAKLPEGEMATATLRREPTALPAKKIGMLDAQKALFERAIETPDSPVTRELAAPEVPPGPGKQHPPDLWADANITAARERIKERQAEYPEAERNKDRQRGYIGEVEGVRNVRAYDWADAADAINIGVNMLLKHGMNKDVWTKAMVAELGAGFGKRADRAYSESVAAFNARRPNGLDEVRSVVDDYNRKVGLGPTAHNVYAPLDDRFMGLVANAFEKLKDVKPDTPKWRKAKQSYDHLNQEIAAQYKAMVDAGYKVEFGADPYPTSADMRADVSQNKRIKAFATPVPTPEGALAEMKTVNVPGVSLSLGIDGRIITLDNIASSKPGSGAGTKALSQIATASEKHGVPVSLWVEDVPNQARLVEWYEKNGFQTTKKEGGWVYMQYTPEKTQFHPFMTAEQTNMFRAVHDFFGHAAEGFEFGKRGEDNAFRKHASTLSNKALPALATETRGQNAWVNYFGDHPKMEPKDRPYAAQKAGLVPKWVYEDVMKARLSRAPRNKLGAGFDRVKGDDVVPTAEKLSRGVQRITEPDGTRARFTSDGGQTVNEMMRTNPQSAKWYHDDIAKMHARTAERLPEVHTPGGQTLFDLLLGFTSPRKPVVDNYAIAFQMADDFFRTGKVPMLQRFGQEINTGSRKWVPRLNSLIERFEGNLDALREFLLTKDEKGVYNVTKEFGPKVGPFTLNIQGIHDQVTVDLWMVRRLRRLTGTLFRRVEGKRVFNDNEAPTREERRVIEDSIRELSKQNGLDADAIQAILWDHEKMMWENGGYAAPRIPFNGAADIVFRNMDKNAAAIEAKYATPDLFQ
jgi:hypothetical protein